MFLQEVDQKFDEQTKLSHPQYEVYMSETQRVDRRKEEESTWLNNLIMLNNYHVQACRAQ